MKRLRRVAWLVMVIADAGLLEFHERIGSENLLPSVDAALARARLLTEAAQRTIDVPVAS